MSQLSHHPTKLIPTLQAEGICKNYGRIQALNKINFAIYPGEVIGLVGDNGAGKSSFIKVLSGAISPDSGKLFLDGEAVSFSTPSKAREFGIETVYQDLSLAPHLNIEENIFLGREILKNGWKRWFRVLDKKAMVKHARESLDALHIRISSMQSPIAELSGGQRQAVAVARSVAWGKKLVILDEPTNHLGVEEVEMVLELIKNVKNKGIPVIFISHTLPHVFEVTDRIVVMRLGEVTTTLKTQETNLNEVISWITGSQSLKKEGGYE